MKTQTFLFSIIADIQQLFISRLEIQQLFISRHDLYILRNFNDVAGDL